MIEMDFIPKGVKWFDRSSQVLDFEYKKYSMLFIWEQLVLVVLVEKRKGEWQGQISEEPKVIM
jgi:hypothetical protein